MLNTVKTVFPEAPISWVGDGSLADTLLTQAADRAKLTPDTNDDEAGIAALSAFLFRLGRRQHRAGDFQAALESLTRVCDLERSLGKEVKLAVAKSAIAQVLVETSRSMKALSLLWSEVLPIYERRGEVLAQAETHRWIANIRNNIGELENQKKIDEISSTLWESDPSGSQFTTDIRFGLVELGETLGIGRLVEPRRYQRSMSR